LPDQFQGNQATRLAVSREIDDRHATTAEALEQLVFADHGIGLGPVRRACFDDTQVDELLVAAAHLARVLGMFAADLAQSLFPGRAG
jgi:hypothetical protein